MNRYLVKYFSAALVVIFISACGDMEEKSNKLKEQQYTGPQAEIDSMYTVYSDSGKILFTIRASKQVDHFNGDRDFPGPLFIEFYEDEGDKGILASTLSANEGKYVKEENLYTVTGNVIVTNLEENETLRTEELNWLPGSDSIYTHRAVVIRTPTEVLHGEGLSSNQSFTKYRILRPIGEFEVNE
ncbi:LPS export ABC transporter periplasmic protein LptC [Marinigracilibium pacificum]|uniref:LPS export ABC transporter periplasmic protein LptC n=1 Tax=Marinigracilibium pacificum TaxID=2729599 RepID=A0A848IR93_9BACT|nr:LPS export ABC transporter periplasmic protein LptC [Marinigracilibium pacificum]NMM46877.1 LPS export ABC transporter periplasmic protein LptC [Marinigracilibium pacificum]